MELAILTVGVFRPHPAKFNLAFVLLVEQMFTLRLNKQHIVGIQHYDKVRFVAHKTIDVERILTTLRIAMPEQDIGLCCYSLHDLLLKRTCMFLSNIQALVHTVPLRCHVLGQREIPVAIHAYYTCL